MMEYTLFGESHGGVVGVVLEHVPAGIAVDEGFTAAQLLRRAPRGAAATARHESDEVAYLSGVFEGKTTGMPLVAVLRNGDVRPGDYEALRRLPVPAMPTMPPSSGRRATRTTGAAATTPAVSPPRWWWRAPWP